MPSVGSVGDSCDNALAETINGLYKPVLSFAEAVEVIWCQWSWPSASAVEMPNLRWVDWFNNHRLFGSIGYIPPAEAEAITMQPLSPSIWSHDENETASAKPGALQSLAL